MDASRKDEDLQNESFNELLARHRAGDREALGKLIALVQSRLRRRAELRFEQRLKSKVGISDLIQRTIVRAIQSISSFRGKTKEQLYGWLVRILDHEIVSCHREYHQQKRDIDRETPLRDVSAEDRIARSFPEAPDPPADSAIKMEGLRSLVAAIGRLGLEDRQCIRFRLCLKMPFEEIGRQLGCTEEAARKRYERARQRLREEMKEGSASF